MAAFLAKAGVLMYSDCRLALCRCYLSAFLAVRPDNDGAAKSFLIQKSAQSYIKILGIFLEILRIWTSLSGVMVVLDKFS